MLTKRITSVDIYWAEPKKKNPTQSNTIILIALKTSPAKKKRCQYINANSILQNLVQNATDHPTCQGSQEWTNNWSQASVLIKALCGFSFNMIWRKYRCQDVLNTTKWDKSSGLRTRRLWSIFMYHSPQKTSRAPICSIAPYCHQFHKTSWARHIPHHFIGPFDLHAYTFSRQGSQNHRMA